MFTPEYLNELVESSHASASEFNMYLTDKVIDSVVNLFEKDGVIDIIPTNQHRLALLKQSGILVSDIEKEIRKRLPGVEKKIREAFLQAGYEINEDINKSVADMVESDKELKDFVGKAPRLEHLTESEKKLLDAAYKRTRGEIRNLTRTTAADLNQQFAKSCDAAWWKATHGVDRYTAIREAISEVSRYGTHVVYKGGRKMTVEAATRMCVLTGINQANAEITLTECANAGLRTVLVSSHIGARYTDKDEPANHQSWQGKIYSISDSLLEKMGYEEPKKNIFGKIKDFFQKFRKQKKYPDLEEVTGYGTVQGLCGANCRHTMHMHYPGNSNPYKDYDNEENKKKYDLFQKQRSKERRIRETKKRMYDIRHSINVFHDENQIAAMKEELSQIKSLFDRQFGEYESFCKQNGLHIDQERLYVGNQKGKVADFGREQTKQSNQGARRYANNKPDSVEKSADFDIMKMKGKLSDVEARKWYIEQNNKIPTLIDRTKTLEEQARQACNIRNNNRTIARDLMKDQNKRKALDISDPTIPFEELVQKKMFAKGISYEEAIADIVQTATKTRRSVNKALGLED